MTFKTNVIALVVGALSYYLYKRPDFIVTFLPKYYDGYFVQYMYKDDRVNAGASKLPMITRMVPHEFSKLGGLKDLFDPHGYPKHVKNVIPEVDQDTVMNIMTRGNSGKKLRVITFEGQTDPHYSPTCAGLKVAKDVMFDEYVKNHLYSNSSHNSTYYYAGFEAITDASTVQEVLGIDTTQLGDYRLNNLFVSNFEKETFTAALHCAPIDSLSIQLVGTKTWFFMSPENLNEIPAVPIPTSFNLPLTDDELLERTKHLYVVTQGPGEALYFGPHWCHAVSTAPGPNLMLNIRYNNIPLMKRGPFGLFAKIFSRKILGRMLGGLPQENMQMFPVLYDTLVSKYSNCGPSAFMDIWRKYTSAA
jgi:hypothetical protein